VPPCPAVRKWCPGVRPVGGRYRAGTEPGGGTDRNEAVDPGGRPRMSAAPVKR